jgi:integrase
MTSRPRPLPAVPPRRPEPRQERHWESRQTRSTTEETFGQIANSHDDKVGGLPISVHGGRIGKRSPQNACANERGAREWSTEVGKYCAIRDAQPIQQIYKRRIRRTLVKLGDSLKAAGVACHPKEFGDPQMQLLRFRLWPPMVRTTDGYANSTRVFHFTIVHHFLRRYGHDERFWWRIHVVRGQLEWTSRSKLRQALTTAQARRVLTASQHFGAYAHMLVALELTMGLRRSEVLRLTVDQVKKPQVDFLGKGRLGGKWRDVPRSLLVSRLLPHVLRERARNLEGAKGADPGWLLAHVLQGEIRPYSASWVDSTVLHPAFEAAGISIPGNLNHSLRRTFGRTLWKRGVPIEVVARMLGHENTQQTMTYLAIDVDDTRSAMSRLNSFFC